MNIRIANMMKILKKFLQIPNGTKFANSLKRSLTSLIKTLAGKIPLKPKESENSWPDRESVRVMSGDPYSLWAYQRKDYIVHMKNGQALDVHGNAVEPSSLEAHIPYEDFMYKP